MSNKVPAVCVKCLLVLSFRHGGMDGRGSRSCTSGKPNTPYCGARDLGPGCLDLGSRGLAGGLVWVRVSPGGMDSIRVLVMGKWCAGADRQLAPVSLPDSRLGGGRC